MAADKTSERMDALQAYIMHHVQDGHEWALPGVTLPVPGLTLHGLMLVIGAIFLLLLFTLGYRRQDKVPRGVGNVLELFVVFIRDQICIPNLGAKDGRKLTPLFCTFFFFIFMLNGMGLIPLFATATSNLGVTSALALITLGFMIIGGVVKNGPVGFVKIFVPGGIPWPILIMLTPLEILGMFTKAFALMIRLFANMLAGHIVIFSLVGLVYIFGWLALPALALAVGVYMLEILIAFLQAFIFTLLSAIFMGQLYHPSH